jgi:hypothetical protein
MERTHGRGRERKATTPFSIRLTACERESLRAKAGGVPLGTFVRRLVLDEAAPARASRSSPMRDSDALGRVLGLIGRAGYGACLEGLARAAAAGTLPIDPETLAAIHAACADVKAIRALLMQALGLRPGTAELPPSAELSSPAEPLP